MKREKKKKKKNEYGALSHARFARSSPAIPCDTKFFGLAMFCVLRERILAIRTNWFFLLEINSCDFQKVPSTQHLIIFLSADLG